MAEISLDDLKVGPTLITATETNGTASYTGTVSDIKWYPTQFGTTDVYVWMDRGEGTKHDVGLRLTYEEDPPMWTFRKNVNEVNRRARGLAEVSAFKRNVPEEIFDSKVAPMLGLKKTAKKGGRKTRRRKTRKSRR
jgi:hypothetical protein